jgi:hypothetical protein
MSWVVSRLALCAACVLVLTACGGDEGPVRPTDVTSGKTASDGGESGAGLDGGVFDVPCTVEAPTSCPDPAPRFDDVSPIFKQRCASCHVSEWTGPWPLDTYPHIADWADVIRGHLLDCTMPPPEAGTPMPNDESEKILTWIRCNTPK